MLMRALAPRQEWFGLARLRLRLRLRPARREVQMMRGVQQVRMSDDLQQDAWIWELCGTQGRAACLYGSLPHRGRRNR